MPSVSSWRNATLVSLSFVSLLVADSSRAETAEPMTTVVTATRSETPATSVSSTVTVITAEQLRQSQALTVAEALRDVPGVDIARAGGLGATASVFMRGTESNHTLVLVDGVELASPGGVDGAVDLADLSTEGVERIEILRGPASSLYGSDALGGVIHVITRKGQGPVRFSLQAEGGAFDTFRGTASAAGTAKQATYALTASRLSASGISHARFANGNSERDGYGRTLLNGRFGYEVSTAVRAAVSLRFTQAHSELDDFGFVGLEDDRDFTQRTDQLLVHPEVSWSLFEGKWRQEVGLAFSHHSRSLDNAPDGVGDFLSRGLYLGRKTRLDWVHRLALHPNNSAMALVETEWDAADIQSLAFGSTSRTPWTTMRTVSAALQDQQRLFDRMTLTASARVDVHSVFGQAFTYSVGAVGTVPGTDTQLRANIGTGFKAPTVLQLADPLYGNAALKPERSLAYEAGAEQVFGNTGFSLGATVFRNDIQNLIGFDSATFASINVGRARILGLESFAQWQTEGWRVRLDGTWMRPLDLVTGKDLVRRARQKVVLSAHWMPSPRTSLGARLGYVGTRTDLDLSTFPSTERPLSPYWLASLMVRHGLTSQLSVFGRVENLLNQRYEDILGYATPGISAYAGVSADL